MKLHYLFAFGFILLSQVANSQIVETIDMHPNIADGLHVDPSGKVYTVSGGFQNGFDIGMYDPATDGFTPTFATGFFGPVDIDQYHDSLFVVTNYDNNTTYQYNLNTGQITVLATGQDGPAGIAIDSVNCIYVTNWGGAPAYAGHVVHKIYPNGTMTEYLDSSVLYRLQAICFNHEGDLIVHSQQTMYKVNAADSTLQFWTNIPDGVANMKFRQADSCIYGGSPGNGRIIRIAPDGTSSVYAGSTAGNVDGDISVAQFSDVLGVEFSPSEDTLYVSEGGTSHRLKRILMNETTGLFKPVLEDLKVYPNPAETSIYISNDNREEYTIEIIDLNGTRVLRQVSNEEKIKLDIEDFASGQYTILVETEGCFHSEKLIKQ